MSLHLSIQQVYNFIKSILANIHLGVSIKIVFLLLLEQLLLLVIRRHPVAEARHLPEGAGLDVAPEPGNIQDNTERHSKQAEPDNVVRVEVATGQVAVISTMVNTAIRLYSPARISWLEM